MCCICNVVCSHIGPHSYCQSHAAAAPGPVWVQPFPVPVFDLTDHQMLQFLVQHAQRMEKLVSDLTTEVQELKAAVAGVLTRITATVDGLLADVAAGHAALAAFEAADATEDAAYQQAIADLQAALAASVAASQAAADEISPLSDKLNEALVPVVVEPPVEEPAVEEPVVEEAPVEEPPVV
jgi:hypothetical protein